MNISTHINAWREGNPRVYRAHLLHVFVIAHADGAGVYCPPTKVGLRRALAHRGQTDGEAMHSEVETALKHAVSQGALRHDSTIDRLILTGSTARETGAPHLLSIGADAERPTPSPINPTIEENR